VQVATRYYLQKATSFTYLCKNNTELSKFAQKLRVIVDDFEKCLPQDEVTGLVLAGADEVVAQKQQRKRRARQALQASKEMDIEVPAKKAPGRPRQKAAFRKRHGEKAGRARLAAERGTVPAVSTSAEEVRTGRQLRLRQQNLEIAQNDVAVAKELEAEAVERALQMLKVLRDHGDDVPDDVLAEVQRVCEAKNAAKLRLDDAIITAQTLADEMSMEKTGRVSGIAAVAEEEVQQHSKKRTRKVNISCCFISFPF
jgi:hypothetical protein